MGPDHEMGSGDESGSDDTPDRQVFMELDCACIDSLTEDDLGGDQPPADFKGENLVQHDLPDEHEDVDHEELYDDEGFLHEHIKA